LAFFFSACTCGEEQKKPVEFVPLDTKTGGAETLYDTNVKPVYPADAKPHPLAERLCAALQTMPVSRRAECCSVKPGVMLTNECVRNLSGALASSAVSLEESEVAACEEAMKKDLEGCDWVGGLNREPPSACLGVINGNIKQGEPCRSSLECGDGFRCLGSGPTDLGKCGPPLPAGRLCNTAVDTLATYTRQDDLETRHPACQGFCDRNRCYDAVATGGECKVNVHCGKGNRCKDGRCIAQRFAALGELCLGGDCPPGTRCAGKKCMTPMNEGEKCVTDFECKGACISGKCAKSCSGLPLIFRPVTKTATAPN
jgi:hypothetical protein